MTVYWYGGSMSHLTLLIRRVVGLYIVQSLLTLSILIKVDWNWHCNFLPDDLIVPGLTSDTMNRSEVVQIWHDKVIRLKLQCQFQSTFIILDNVNNSATIYRPLPPYQTGKVWHTFPPRSVYLSSWQHYRKILFIIIIFYPIYPNWIAAMHLLIHLNLFRILTQTDSLIFIFT